MKRRIKGWLKIGLLFTILAGLMSCEMIVDYEFPDQDPKVVVHSFISPGDTLVMVMLTWSKPITRGGFEFEPDFIGNAVVKISEEGGAPANLVYDNTRKLYVIPAAQFPVKEGKQYHLLVQVPGQDEITATTTVPGANNTIRLNRMDKTPDPYGAERLTVEYQFEDSPGSDNFYMATAYIRQLIFDWRNEDYRYEWAEIYRVSGEKFISNRGREGRTFVQRAEYYIYPEYPDEMPQVPSLNLMLVLLKTDEAYYRYHIKLEQHNPDNPFTEPTQAYTNIQGGLGVFASYAFFSVLY